MAVLLEIVCDGLNKGRLFGHVSVHTFVSSLFCSIKKGQLSSNVICSPLNLTHTNTRN